MFYGYMIGTLSLAVVWLVIFIWRKDLRQHMLRMGVLCGFMGLVAALFFNQDWWRPLTVTHTYIGVEDFLFGFVLSGIALTAGKVVTKTTIDGPALSFSHWKSVAVVYVIAYILFISSYLAGLHTQFSSMIAAVGIFGLIIYRRKDLVRNALITAPLIPVLAIAFYITPGLLYPQWIFDTWMMENLSGVIFLWGPAEDYLWYVFVGVGLGSLYEYFTGGKLRKLAH